MMHSKFLLATFGALFVLAGCSAGNAQPAPDSKAASVSEVEASSSHAHTGTEAPDHRDTPDAMSHDDSGQPPHRH